MIAPGTLINFAIEDHSGAVTNCIAVSLKPVDLKQLRTEFDKLDLDEPSPDEFVGWLKMEHHIAELKIETVFLDEQVFRFGEDA